MGKVVVEDRIGWRSMVCRCDSLAKARPLRGQFHGGVGQLRDSVGQCWSASYWLCEVM